MVGSTRRAGIRPPPIFYGWWIVLGAFVLQALVGGLFGQAYGAYLVHWQRQFDWSKTVLSGAYSLAQLEGGFLGPIQGWLVDKLGPRTLVRVGAVIFGLGLMALSRIESVVALYGAVLVVTVGSGLCGFLTVNATLVNWFERRRATAMGLAATGWGAAGLMVPALAVSLNTFGWRATVFYSGVLIILVGFPVAQLMRRAPEPYGYLPDGRARDAAEAPVQRNAGGSPPRPESPDGSFTVGEALRSPAFWLLNAGHGAALLVVSAAMVHLIPHLVERMGMSLTSAAGVMALVTTLSIVGQVTGGLVGDRADKRLICALCMLGHMVGLLALAVGEALPLVIFFAVVHGLAWGVRGPLMAAIRADYFGRGSFATIFGFASMIVTLGFVAGPIFAGFMADWLGDYRVGFTVLALMAGAGSVFFLLARKPGLPDRAPLAAAPTVAL